MTLMKIFKVIIVVFMLFLSACNAFSADENVVEDAEKMFKENLSIEKMVFTKVPRGLVISIDEEIFFKKNSDKIRRSGVCFLNNIGTILNKLNVLCIIEGHTESLTPENSRFKTNWELSLARANNIAKYLMRCSNILPEKLVAIGFGEFMPFKDNVSDKAGMNNRIDFVIMHYDLRR